MPKPAFDPWLSHLRRDRRGLPVPYINAWAPEEEGRMRIAYDRHAERRAMFLDDADGTEPDFTRQNMGRQRECMDGGRCQVCHRQVPWSRRRLVVSDVSVKWEVVDELGGRRVPVIHEPWLDERCAAIATAWCPALTRRERAGDLLLVPVTSKRDVQLVLSVGALTGPLEAETRADPVGMWVKARLLTHRIEPAFPLA